MDIMRLEELIAESTIKSLLESKLEEEKSRKCILWTLALIGAVALVAAISFVVYRLASKDEFEDLDDDLFFDEDEFIDFFDDEDEMEEEPAEEPAAEEEAPAEEPVAEEAAE